MRKPRRGGRRDRGAGAAVVAIVAGLLTAALATQPASAAPGDITTVAGGAKPQNGIGDGGPATNAALIDPFGIAAASGGFFVS